MKATLIFDYDGTIHDTMKIYEPAFRECYEMLTNRKLVKSEQISSDQIAAWLGWNVKDMWNSFQPGLEQKEKDRAGAWIGRSMLEQIRSHKAAWYPHAEELLDELKEAGYHMVVLSNCTGAYRKANWDEFDMGRWFSDFFDCESYKFAPKHEIVKDVIKKYPGRYIVIGDRKTDLECAEACSCPFVACSYGFGQPGELEDCKIKIGEIRELSDVLQRL